jgi:hypothetical protein
MAHSERVLRKSSAGSAPTGLGSTTPWTRSRCDDSAVKGSAQRGVAAGVGTGMLTLPFCGITMNWILPDSIADFSK